jgi:hypothetical protein
MQIVTDRARTTRQTLIRIERGDPAVSMGIYASVPTEWGRNWKRLGCRDAGEGTHERR